MYISNFEDAVTRYAAAQGCEAVICGHIHTPKATQVNGVDYYNTGDWVESCTALIEYADGRLELFYFTAPPSGAEAACEQEDLLEEAAA